MLMQMRRIWEYMVDFCHLFFDGSKTKFPRVTISCKYESHMHSKFQWINPICTFSWNVISVSSTNKFTFLKNILNSNNRRQIRSSFHSFIICVFTYLQHFCNGDSVRTQKWNINVSTIPAKEACTIDFPIYTSASKSFAEELCVHKGSLKLIVPSTWYLFRKTSSFPFAWWHSRM